MKKYSDGTIIDRDEFTCKTHIIIPDEVFQQAGQPIPKPPMFQLPVSILDPIIAQTIADCLVVGAVKEARALRRKNYLRRFPYLRAFIK